jgi:hypothetical protein
MEIRQQEPEAAGQNKPLPYCDFWNRSSKLLLSSVNRGGPACQLNCAGTARAFSPGGVLKPIPISSSINWQ